MIIKIECKECGQIRGPFIVDETIDRIILDPCPVCISQV